MKDAGVTILSYNHPSAYEELIQLVIRQIVWRFEAAARSEQAAIGSAPRGYLIGPHQWYQSGLDPMETRKKTLEQFQQETHENFEKFTAMMERLMSDVQSLKDKPPSSSSGFKGGPMVVHGSEVKPYLKLHFPRFSGDDPTGCIALQWHRWHTKTRGPLTWEEFTKALLTRFGPTDYDDAAEALHRLKQVTTVAAYQESFERLSNRVDGLPESFLVGCFIGGLKEEIRLEVKLKNPRQLVDAIGVARVVEEKFNLQRRVVSGTRSPGFNATPRSSSSPANTTLNQCLDPQNKDVVVLVDGGSTHNFIDQAWGDRFGLIVAHDVHFEVVVGNREKMVCTGRVKDLTIVIQGYTITTDFFVLPVAACPIVLGVQWLKTLGPIEIDFEKLTLGFRLAGSSHILQGLKRSELTALKSHECMGLNGTAMLLQISPIIDNPLPDHTPCPAVQSVLFEFADIFQEPKGLPPRRFQDHSIPLLPGSQPVSSRPYRQPYYQKTEIEKQVRELLQQGLIRPSHNPFSSPVLLVKKSDGTWRFCVDYRALNDITVKDKYPIPIIDELLDELYGAKVYSKLDLRSGYHQIRVREGDIHKTAFRTHEGHYEFVVMPFGLTNAPATFQCLMNDLFRQYLRKFILVFFDDILIYSKSIDEHVEHVREVLGILKANHLFVKASKCCFGVTQVNYLGHVINSNGVSVEAAKVEAVLSWPVPTNAKGVRGFLGLAGYYRKFIKGFGSIVAPLHKLVGKGPFVWDETANKAFELLKIALTTTPTLGLPDWSKPFTIECDASGVGIGAIYRSTYEKEMLAVVKAVRKWRPYLLGRAFVVITDHMSLKYLLEQRISTPAQTKWLTKILGYDYKIDYKKGATNRGADALSRQYLRCFTGDKPKKWTEWLPWAEYSYNTSMHTSTKMMPFQVVYGRLPPKLVPYIPGTTKVQEVDEYLCDRDEVLRQLRNNLLAAQNRMKVNADRHRRELEFNVGDLVYIKLQPYRQSSVVSRYSAKLAPRFFGPYKILNRVGPVAYRVELPPGSLIHDVFHVSLLRRFVGTTPEEVQVTQDEPVVSPTLMQPEEILEERVVQKGKYRPKTELLVKWKGRPRKKG
ncbi:transposon ty3-G gag-pol polyprotein [Tanacetum coccineum]